MPSWEFPSVVGRGGEGGTKIEFELEFEFGTICEVGESGSDLSSSNFDLLILID
jgi:hypothetical protein